MGEIITGLAAGIFTAGTGAAYLRLLKAKERTELINDEANYLIDHTADLTNGFKVTERFFDLVLFRARMIREHNKVLRCVVAAVFCQSMVSFILVCLLLAK